jgi:hypothetical protein
MQIMILHNVNKFNKGKWAKRDFFWWNENLNNEYYTYSMTFDFDEEIFEAMGQW